MPVQTLTCPEDCADFALPAVSFDDCFPKTESSEITTLYIALADASPLTDASSPTEWADRLSQTATPPTDSETPVGDLIRSVKVTGDLPAPTEVTKDLSGGRYGFVVGNDFTLNFDIDDLSDENYALARTTECGYMKVRFWFKDLGGMLYGGNAGIVGDAISGARLKINPVYGRGKDEIVKLTGTITWRAKTAPDRCVSPI